MKKVIQIVGVILLLGLSVKIRSIAKEYSAQNYDFFMSLMVRGTLVLFLYQMCYWLIEKYDDLILLIKKFHYFIGFMLVMLGINLGFCYFMFMIVWMKAPSLFMDVTITEIISFIICTLIGNYLIKRLLKVKEISY